MDGTLGGRPTALWVVVGGVVACCVLAVLLDAPSAALGLAALCAALAAVRAHRREQTGTFRVRSTTFDVTALAILAIGLIVLAPAGYLT